MDWGKQYLEVYKNWAEGQVKTGQGWFEAVQGADKFDPGLIMSRTIDAYQASIQGTLDAEVAGSRVLFEEFAAVEGLPKEFGRIVQQLQGMNKQFTGMQQEFVNVWFDFVRRIDFAGLPVGLLQEEPKKIKVTAKA